MTDFELRIYLLSLSLEGDPQRLPQQIGQYICGFSTQEDVLLLTGNLDNCTGDALIGINTEW